MEKNKFYFIALILFLMHYSASINAQTKEDTLAIQRAALDYIESQHRPNPIQMQKALHPLLVKRTFWKDKVTQKEYITESNAEFMIIIAERYNLKGDKFPEQPRKEVKLLDISDRTASVKLIADEWIDYMHLVKVNNEWKIINVLWQLHDSKMHE